MSNLSTTKQDFLDAKSIPKFQFQLIDQQLINCIKQLYVQSKNQQKSITQHNKQLKQKVNILSLVDSFKLIESKLQFSPVFQNLINSSGKSKDYNDPQNPLLSSTYQLSNKFSHFAHILQGLNSKILDLQKRIQQSQASSNKTIKQKVSSVQQQLNSFVKDYRLNFNNLTKKVQDNRIQYENKTKAIQSNTLWKINQCYKRLEDRPNVEMVRNSVEQLESKLVQLIKKSENNDGSGYYDTSKIQQNVIKLQKQMDSNFIQTQSQIKRMNQKLNQNYVSLKFYSQQKIENTKKFQNLSINNNEIIRKLKYLETQAQSMLNSQNKVESLVQSHNQQLLRMNNLIGKLTKNDDFAKLMQKIDPHQLCRLSSAVKNIEERSQLQQSKIRNLSTFLQSLRSKTEFWNVAAEQNPRKNQGQQINTELIVSIIKEQFSNSQLSGKMIKFERQVIDLLGLKQAVSDILKKVSKLNKDGDMIKLKYQIQGLQQYIKREVLILNNRMNSCQVKYSNLNDSRNRPLTARGKTEDGRLMTTVSTKKLLPVGCISCHQTNLSTGDKQRKKVFSSKLLFK